MKASVTTTVQYVFFALLFTASSFFVSQSALRYASVSITESAQTAAEPPVTHIVIDPGHGGEDGGASSGDTLEKDLNLMISENLLDLFTIFGYNAVPTRTEDILLYDHYDDFEDYTGKKKTYDLKNRLRIAEESGAELYLGIHMNKFSDTSSRGLQVYYSANTDTSRTAAERIQTLTKTYLMPDNDRAVKKATSAIYILNRIRIPAVLVECGFLSNAEDLAQLNTPEYRKKLSAVIFASAAEFITEEN